MFYTNHGVPIKQDKTWNYSKRFNIATVPMKDRFNLKAGYKTARLNMNRGPRFYADLGFDGSIWYGQGNYDDTPPSNLFWVRAKKGQADQIHHRGRYSMSGYWPKKLVNYKSVISASGLNAKPYPWPVMTVANLYLLYAEAKNEADGPGPQVYKYLNLIRKRAGLPTVQFSWSHYSTKPNEYKTKAGLRKIIHRERLIELAFEGKRFWALRRWKVAIQKMNTALTGWSRKHAKARGYYRVKTIYQQSFTERDYLWPLSEQSLLQNPHLKQNPGWSR